MEKTVEKYILLGFIAVVIVGIIVFVVHPTAYFWIFRPGYRIVDRVAITHSHLELNRYFIEDFKNTTGDYPESISDVNDVALAEAGTKVAFSDEYISDANGNCSFHDRLNGQGGWFYDPNTGEVKVNLTEPVEYYIPNYPGEYRNQVPASW